MYHLKNKRYDICAVCVCVHLLAPHSLCVPDERLELHEIQQNRLALVAHGLRVDIAGMDLCEEGAKLCVKTDFGWLTGGSRGYCCIHFSYICFTIK